MNSVARESHIGRRIRELRETHGLTIEELAAKIGMSRTNLNKRELGIVRVRRDELRTFADAFGVSVGELAEVASLDAEPKSRGIPVLNRDEAGLVIDYRGADPMHMRPRAEYLERDPHTQDEHLFSLVVVGDSMSPEIMPGDRLILYPMSESPPIDLISGRSVVLAELAPGHRTRHVLGRYIGRPDGSVEIKPTAGKPTIVERGKLAKLSVVVQVRRNY